MATVDVDTAFFVTMRTIEGVRELVVVEGERDRELEAVVVAQLLAFWREAKQESDLYPRDTRDTIALRRAIRAAREERVGDEKVFVI